VSAWVARFGAFGLSVVAALGSIALVLGRTAYHLPRLERRELLRGLHDFGYRSLPLTLGIAAVTGASVVVQTTVYVERFGARSMLGWAAGYAMLWEMGPLLLGLMMAGRIGARNAAELAMLEVNGNLEGLRGISLDPFSLLIAPRVLAMVISLVALTVVMFAVAVAFEAIAAYFALELPPRVFFGGFADMLRVRDLLGGLTKSTVFGLATAVISTTVGLRASGGARAVGQSAASAVVWSAFAIFALDLLLTPPLARALS
jgi:phospholipid/cholesterol/gamma-HCH transport system permease protein